MDVVLLLVAFAVIAATGFVAGLNQPESFRDWTGRVIATQAGLGAVLVGTWIATSSVADNPLIVAGFFITVFGAAELGRRQRRSRNSAVRPE